MEEKQLTIIKQQLMVRGEQVLVSSRTVARAFGKKHKHVLRDIETLDCSKEFTGSNFEPSEYVDPTGRVLPMYEMTRNGFMFLAMSYRGRLAARIKEAYIVAFDAMEAELASRRAVGADALLALQAAAARAGHGGNFLPRLTHLTRAGLSSREIGMVLGIGRSTVSCWQRKLRDAGVELPRLAQSFPARMQPLPAASPQQSLPGMEVAQ